MNPGVFGLMTSAVASILFATGWGTRYIVRSGLRTRHWVLILLSLGVLGCFDVTVRGFLVNMGAVTLALLLGLHAAKIKKAGEKLQFLSACITAAACCLLLMNWVPRDPAFYLLDEQYLYPAASVLTVYVFSREPLFCLNASAGAILLAGTVHDNRFPAVTGAVHLGGSEWMDLVAGAMIASFFVDHAIQTAGYVLAKTVRRPEGNLEGDSI